MRAIIGIGASVIWLTSTALADKYNDLVVKGYRWVTTDGPFACASKENALLISKNHSDENTLRLVEQGGVYFLIRGVIVQVVAGGQGLGYVTGSLEWNLGQVRRPDSIDEQ